jgi:hypothetical protein
LFNPHFLKISISAQHRFFFEGPKVSKGKRLETVGVFIVFFPISLPLGLQRGSASSASLRFLSCAVKNVAKGKRIQSHRTTGKKKENIKVCIERMRN